MEGADRVLYPVKVHSHLAAYGGIHLRENGGGYVVKIYTTHVDSSRETGQIANNASAHSHNTVTAVHAVFKHFTAQSFKILEALGLFTLNKGDDFGVTAGIRYQGFL